MSLYRKRPLIVEATRWFPGVDHPGVQFWPETSSVYPGQAYVTTIHEQPAFLADGDWIIAEPDGIHYYPCKPDIFEKTYESVPDPLGFSVEVAKDA